MVSLDHIIAPKRCISLNAESVRSIWCYVLEKIMRQGGPFAGVYKSDQFEEMADTAVRLFPDGHPDRSRKWRVPEGVSVLEYGPFLSRILSELCRLRYLTTFGSHPWILFRDSYIFSFDVGGFLRP